MDIEATHLERVFDLYAQGLCLQAYRYTEQLGPLHEWSGTEARIMGGRLAGNLGGMHLAYWLHLQAWRYDREHPHACYYYARVTLHRRGPLEAWKILRRYGDLPDATPKLRAEWMAFPAM
jgi:hypothetical protein